jgi:glycosyltransferase involved in cell wall biosynthesis
MTRVYYFFRRSILRQNLLKSIIPDPGACYLLYGLDHLNHHAFVANHNLEAQETAPPSQGRLASLLNSLITGLGGIGGDFQTVISHRHKANHSELVLATVDTVGIPLVFFKWIGLIRPPLIYISIGLPERIQTITGKGILRIYRNAFHRVDRFITYGWEEALWLRRWLDLTEDSTKVVFIPFGVNCEYFSPRPDISPSVDVLTIGADPQRDFTTLFWIASRHPEVSFRVIAGKDHASGFTSVPSNVEVHIDLPFPEIRNHLAAARLVALPVHENTYSAGTTTLLQAMAMARPIVVSQTGAIREGYELQDGQNCRLIPPGDHAGFEVALMNLLGAPDVALQMGLSARQTAEHHLTWDQYEQKLFAVLKAASSLPIIL